MRTRTRLTVLCVTAALILAMIGIGYAQRPKGTLRVAYYEENLSLDPTASTMRVTLCAVRPLMFDPLITRDKNGNFQPALATSWKQIDETTWEFSLRKGVKFHNGEAFNAQSVKRTFQQLLDPTQMTAQGFLWEGIKEVVAADDYTVRIITHKPLGTLLANLSLGAMLPPSYDPKIFSTRPVGTGPFKFIEWVRGDHLTVEANPDYWGGAPKIQRVEFYPILEDSTRVSAAVTGEVDIAHTIAPSLISMLKANPNVELKSVTSVVTPVLSLGGGGRPPIGGRDGTVLRAIDYAIDRQRLIKDVFKGYATVARSVVAPAVFGYHPNEPRPYDPEKAKQLLAEAGYPNGFKVDLWYTKGGELAIAEAVVAIHDMLRKVGIEASIRVAPDWAAGGPVLNTGNFDIYYNGWGDILLDADFNLWGNWHPRGRNREGADKYPQGQELARLIEVARFSTDREVRKDAYAKAQDIIWDVYPTRLPIVNYYDLYAVNKRVRGFEPRSDMVIDYTNIWLDK